MSGSSDAGLRPLALAAVTWDFPLVGRTRMLAEAWSARGVENDFVQVPSRRTALQRWTQGRRAQAGATTVLRPGGGLLARAPLEGAAARRAARRLRAALGRAYPWERAVALVVHPRWEPWLDELPFGRVLYDCIDDLAVHAPDPALRARVARLEERLLARCDGALATAEVLLADLRRRRPELPLRLVRNGVDDVGFQRAAQGPRPADLPRGRPLVGFVGALYEWLDWELVRAVARACPEVDFAFVGPRAGEAAGEPAPGLANVRLLGPRPYADVPRYVAAFDACWVPFRVDRVGRAANPVKLYEYLALGKPACSTPVADLNSFEGLVSAAEGAEAMTQALRAALAEGAARATERRAFAARNAWSARAAEVLAFAGSLARA